MAFYQPGIVFIGMETSGVLRRRFQAQGFETYSCDTLPCEDAGGDLTPNSDDGLPLGCHLVGDVFEALDNLWANDLWPSLAIFHPTCTFLTASAEWAYADPDFDRYPGVGYHQRIQAGTLTGASRREARENALDDVRRIEALKIDHVAYENPKGVIGTRIRPPSQIIQPNHYGDDASKATCLWLRNLPRVRPTCAAPGRIVDDGRSQMGLFGTGAIRFSNQTDAGQNRLSPGEDRWKERSRTYPGVADAMVNAWAPYVGRAVAA
jgi:hypothetical protein